jgi:hypothetical protein
MLLWSVGIIFVGVMLIAKLVKTDWEWVRRLSGVAFMAAGGFYIFGPTIMSIGPAASAVVPAGVLGWFGFLCVWSGWSAYRN